MEKKILGRQHPDTAATMYSLAGIYVFQGRYAEAELLYKQALQIRTELLGRQHPDTIRTLTDIASFYKFRRH